MSRRLLQRETLQQQCMWFILMHLEELPPNYLALLPLSIRKEIITRLPIADVCRLEETPFVDGLDLKPYWRSYLSPMRLFYRKQQHLCLDLQRICEDKWGPVEFAKASFYSKVAESILNGATHNLGVVIQAGESEFQRYSLPYHHEVGVLCFGIRSVISKTTRSCDFSFPPRYTKYDYDRSFMYVDAAVDAFRGRQLCRKTYQLFIYQPYIPNN